MFFPCRGSSEKNFHVLLTGMKNISEIKQIGNFYPPGKRLSPIPKPLLLFFSKKIFSRPKAMLPLQTHVFRLLRFSLFKNKRKFLTRFFEIGTVGAIYVDEIKSGGPLISRPGSRHGSRDPDSAYLAPLYRSEVPAL